MKIKTLTVAALVTCGLATSSIFAQAVESPLVSFDFNLVDSGVYTNTGSLGTTANGQIKAPGVQGEAGSGTSGVPVDRAFNNTAASGNGSGGTGNPNNRYAGGVQIGSGNLSSLSDMSALTLVTWYKTDSAPAASTRLFDARGGSTSGGNSGGWAVQGDATGNWSLIVGEGSRVATVASTNAAPYNKVGEWVFLAITWNGQNVTFYSGTTEEGSMEQVGDIIAYTGTMYNNINAVATIANQASSTAHRPFDGIIDNFAIYDTALDVATISQIHASALIPEPSSFAFLGGAAAVAITFLRRRRRYR